MRRHTLIISIGEIVPAYSRNIARAGMRLLASPLATEEPVLFLGSAAPGPVPIGADLAHPGSGSAQARLTRGDPGGWTLGVSPSPGTKGIMPVNDAGPTFVEPASRSISFPKYSWYFPEPISAVWGISGDGRRLNPDRRPGGMPQAQCAFRSRHGKSEIVFALVPRIPLTHLRRELR